MTQHRSPPKQMAGLSWTAVTLSLLLYVGNCSVQLKGPNQKGVDQKGPDQNQLKAIVDGILRKYRPSYKANNKNYFPMFSLAVSIPYDNNKKRYDVSGVTDSAQELKDTLSRCEVYEGTRVVAATVLRWPNVLDQCPNEPVQWPDVLTKCRQASMTWAQVAQRCPGAVSDGEADHAEYRTLTAFNTLTNNLNKNDFMLFYVYSSPCSKRCTAIRKRWSILDSINKIMRWDNYAVVFSKVFKPRVGPVPEEEPKGALQRLGTYQGTLGSIGLNNIFRCDGRGSVQCTSCSSGGQVTRYCYTDDPQPPSYSQRGLEDL